MHVGQKLQVVKVKKHYPIIGSCVMCKGFGMYNYRVSSTLQILSQQVEITDYLHNYKIVYQAQIRNLIGKYQQVSYSELQELTIFDLFLST